MGSGLLSVGITGLSVAQLGLNTTGHNISNANTAGYSRQRVDQTTNIPMFTNVGSLGQGARVETIRRSYDQFLAQQINMSQAASGELDAYYAQIVRVDNMLSDPGSGLSPVLQDFFKSVQTAAANPSLLSARQSALSSAQSLVSRFQGMDQHLTELYDGINGDIQNTTTEINAIAERIGKLNGEIVRVRAGNGNAPNDLLDQRDQLLNDLNKLVGVSNSEDNQGAFNIFLGSGQPLVLGFQVSQMETIPSSDDPDRLTIRLKSPSGSDQTLPEDYVKGGSLAGMLKFRRESLDTAANALGQIAAGMALTFNAQHALGQDLDGASQINSTTKAFQGVFFQVPNPKVISEPGNSSTSAIPTVRFKVDGDPTTGNFSTDLRASDYRIEVVADNTFRVTRLSDGADLGSVAGGTAIDGLVISDPTYDAANSVPASLSVGDSFTIQPTREIARGLGINPTIAADTRKMAIAAPVLAGSDTKNIGNMKVSAGTVGEGYAAALPAASLSPLSIKYDGTAAGLTFLNSDGTDFVPAGISLVATYSDGSTASITSTTGIPLTTPTTRVLPPTQGGATLAKIGFVNESSGKNALVVDVTGAPMAGDKFTVAPNTAGVSDNRNALKLAQLQSQGTIGPAAGGRATLQTTYASLVSDIGSKTNAAQVTGDAQRAMLQQNQDTRDSLSAVNLDEEGANLIKYQQAYQASAKVLNIGSSLFDTLLAIMN